METGHFVYILRCADDTLYTGWTTDLSHRLSIHNQKKGAKYTKARTPVEMVYSERLTTKSEALSRERAIKKLTREQKLAMIKKE